MSEKIKAYGICVYKKMPHLTKLLLCKSVNSKDKWGFLKGCEINSETKRETALREFFEESSIEVDINYLETYFEQINKDKDIGIFLVNYNNIENVYKFFENDKLHNHCLSWENSRVEFFDIKKIPNIKKKQYKIMNSIIQYLKKDN
ncbi:MAG: NUDIX domain-containing protein [Campylobacterota bacterium]|nr:NUDIX domain-containing protein [Campylobacterota bacterium]